MAEAKQRLANLFNGTDGSMSSGNDALRYTAPKESVRQRTSISEPTASASASATSNSQQQNIVYSTSASLYRYDASSKSYEQVGGQASLGCVLLCLNAQYSLLFYNVNKEHLCQTSILPNFQCILQKNYYLNFYDQLRTNYSMRFNSEIDASSFLRVITLARAHTGVWGSLKIDGDRIFKQDLVLGKEDSAPIGTGDIAGIMFTAWKVIGNATSKPNDLISSSPFDSSTASDLRKFRIGEGKERIKALEEGVIGMKKGGKRMIISPPTINNTSDWYIIELELVKTKSMDTKPSLKLVMEATSQEDTPSPDTETIKEIVPYEPTPGSPSARDHERKRLQWEQEELDVKRKALEEARTKLLTDQLEAQKRQLEQMQYQQQQQNPAPYSQPSLSGGLYPPPSSNQFIMQSIRPPIPGTTDLGGYGIPSNGNVEHLLGVINTKVDHLIRSNRSLGGGSYEFGLDTASLIKGVERLALENERVAREIIENTSQVESLQKRVNDLFQKNHDLVMENNRIVERLGSAQNQNSIINTELAMAKSAKETAEAQVTRLSAEYRQVAVALNQRQQLASHNTQEFEYEKQARSRLEAELKTETQARSFAEQQLSLALQQHETEKKMLLTEWGSKAQHDKIVLQRKIEELESLNGTYKSRIHDLEKEKNKASDYKAVAEAAVEKVKSLEVEVLSMQKKLTKVNEELKDARNAADEALARGKFSYDQKKIEEITAAHEEVVQKLKLQYETDLSEAVEHAKAEARATERTNLSKQGSDLNNDIKSAEKTLEEAKLLKEEAEKILAGESKKDSEQLITKFKNIMNEVYFRFQDEFQDAETLTGEATLLSIRKILKQSTKEVIQKLEGSENN